MAPQEVLSALRRRPFLPFRLRLTEGSEYEIRHPELCMVGSRTVIIGIPATNELHPLMDRSVIVDLLHVVKLELTESPAKG